MKVFDYNYGLIKSFQAHYGGVSCIKQIPYNVYVVTSERHGEVKVWDPTDNIWSLVRVYKNHTYGVYSIEYINTDIIATGGDDRTIKIWSINTGQTIRVINTKGYARFLLLFPNGFHLAVNQYFYSNNIDIYDINTGGLIRTIPAQNNEHYPSILKLIGNDLLVIGRFGVRNLLTGYLEVFNLTTNTTKFVLQGTGLRVKVLTSDLIASGSHDFGVKFWNITSGENIRNITGNTNRYVGHVDLFNSETLVASLGDESIKFWNWKTGECLKKIQTELSISSMAVINQTTTTSKHMKLLIK